MLFTDIEGSTRLLADLGESAYAEVLAMHHRLIRTAMLEHGGQEIGTEGDSFFVTFGRASDAILAAVDAQRALVGASWPEGRSVRVRMGLHTGPIARAGGNLVGMAIHTAARIKSAAHGGQIVVSAATARDAALDHEVTLTSLGSHRFRDINGRVELFEVGHPELASDFPSLASEPSDFAAVPRPLAGLVGRVRERAAIERLLEEHRVVTITGPPGGGKTRLASAIVAGRNDVAFVDLASLDDPSQVEARVARALGVGPGGEEGALEALIRQLGGDRAVIFVDNCEHLADEVATVVAEIVSRSAFLRVLATSRGPLAIEGEVVWTLEPLAEAAQLFVARVSASHPSSTLSPDDPEIVAICERLDHLPLAVELAAAQVGRMSLSELAGRLDDRFALLRGQRRDAPARHRTLQAALDWSVRLLTSDEQAALRRLAVMRGPFDLEIAEAVCGDSMAAILALRDSSLLTFEGDTRSGRLRMLETVRTYTIDALERSGERGDIEEAHARAFRARAAERLAGAIGMVETFAALDQDADNYQQALQWFAAHDATAALAFAIDLEGLWTTRLSPEVGGRVLQGVLDQASEAHSELRAVGLLLLADIYRNAGRVAEARKAAEESVALGGADARNGRLSAPVVLGQILAVQGELDAATRLFEENLAASHARRDVADVAFTLREIANVALERNLPDEAAAPLDEASELVAVHTETLWLQGLLVADRARMHLAMGRVADARVEYETSMARAQVFGIAQGIAGCSLGLARVERIEGGDRAEARALLQEAIRIYGSRGDVGGLAHVFVEAAMLHGGSGNHAMAIQLLAGAESARARLGIATPGSEERPIREACEAASQALGAEMVERLTERSRETTLHLLADLV